MKLWTILLLSVLLLTANVCEAKKKKSYAMSMKVFKQMEKAQSFAEQEAYAEAFEVLDVLLTKRTSRYEKAQIHSVMGAIHFRNSDLDSAMASFTRVLDSVGGMPDRLHQQTLKTLAQMHMAKEEFEPARDYCEQMLAMTEEPEERDYGLLAQAYYKLEQYQQAIDAAMKGRELAYQKLVDPNENTLLLINASYFEMGQLDKMPTVLEELIRLYPKKSYILYLASIFGQLDRLDKQTVLMESLYEDGKLTENAQLRNLASLYMSEKTPYKGAVLLEESLGNGNMEPTARDYELLAQAWRLAAEREKSLGALQIAAELSDDGQNYLRKAYLHFDMAQWKLARQAILAGLDKGLEERHVGEAWLLLGMTRFQLQLYTQAIEACERAATFDKTRRHAEQWITYIAREKQKRDSMMPTSEG